MREIFNIETGAELPKVESLTEELYNQFKKYVSYKTWMAAETSVVEVDIDTEDVTAVSGINESIYSEVNGTENIDPVEFKDVNLGIAERPETDIVLEKHITGLKITPNGVGVQPIVDAHANIERLLSNDDVLTEGVVTGLAANKSTRETRGFWEVATDVEELMQGAELEVEYTYIVRNEGKQNDYLSNTLVELYKSQDTKSYDSSLDEIINTVKGTMKSGKYGYTADNITILEQ